METDIEKPRSMRLAGWMLWGLTATGALLAIAGVWETSYLASNLPVIEQRSTFPAEALRSAERMRDSAELAMNLGVIAAVGALVCRLLARPGYALARIVTLVFCAVVAIGFVLQMLQDGSIGVHPYTDLSHDMRQEELMNDLMVAPGYFVMLYPAEIAGLILPFLIGWKLLTESSAEYFRRRRKPTPERVFDVSEILAKRQREVQ